jgi:hypothetical protein
MFNRGGQQQQGPASVEIVLEDGHELQGTVLVPPGRTLAELLNGSTSFIEFQPLDGERMFVAKAALHAVKPLNVPAKPDLWAGPTEGSSFDPYAVLGLKQSASREEVRDAYLALAKIYHPDRYATAELPSEVREYLSVMARRINAAYDVWQSAQKKQAARQEPVFTKAGQG